VKPTSSSPASRFVSRVLGSLRGRYRATMLGSWAGERMTPFQHLIGTILSARCRDEVTDVVSRRLFERYPTPEALASARPRAVEKLIRSIGFYRMKATYVIGTARRLVAEFGGQVPATIDELLSFPGVGRKVANCVLVYAFEKAAIPVDTHVHRVSNRLGWVATKAPDQTERALASFLPRRHWLEVNELLVAHGKAVCRPIRPRCQACDVAGHCPYPGRTAKGRAPRRATNR
jgi:endonuclease-3